MTSACAGSKSKVVSDMIRNIWQSRQMIWNINIDLYLVSAQEALLEQPWPGTVIIKILEAKHFNSWDQEN